MKTRNFWAAFTLCCLFLIPTLEAQVTSVNYQIRYNDTICGYDALIIINSGQATTAAHRLQASAQFSLVMPAATTMTIVESFMPMQGNISYDGTTPIDWAVTTQVIAPEVDPGNRYVSITVPLSPASRYNNISSGDTIRLFSFTLSSITQCGEEIRIFRNGIDPSSSEPGMQSSDFSNGFTIGGIGQRYNANSVQLNPPAPILTDVLTNCNNGIEINLTATTSACQTPLSFEWTGPNMYSDTLQNVSIIPSTSADEGLYTVVVTDSIGCTSTESIEALSRPNAGVDQSACAGTIVNLAGTSPTTGSWTSATNPIGGTLNPGSNGLATVTFSASASGTYSYIYSNGVCTDMMSIVVSPRPTVSVSGNPSICIGATTTLSPNSGGTWVSNSPSVATVNATTGEVTAVAQGSATFTFTSDATGCSATTSAVTVNPQPTVTISGTPEVCISSTTTVTPSTGGTWVSNHPLIATVSNTGVVTGVAAGTADLVFTETSTGCVSDILSITVRPRPTITEGSDSICVFTTTQFLPDMGGTWSSSNSAIATINNSGLVTGLTGGKVVLIWTQTSTGCASNPSDSVTVIPRPTVNLSAPVTCVGVTVTASPNPIISGTWISNNTNVATIDAATGEITPIAQGSVTFTFTSTTTTCSNTTAPLTINPSPTVLAASNNICVGAQTTLTPATGGAWTSQHPGIATVANVAGVIRVTGVAQGDATMQFTETGTGCISTLVITVAPRPSITDGAASICIGQTTQLLPSSGGTWLSSSPAAAPISNSGVVTGVSTGSFTFTFTASGGCTSLPSSPVSVVDRPTVSITGNNLVCIGSTTQLNPTSGGTWTSSNNGVATVTDGGVVTAVSAGTATFTFTATGGCASNPTAPVTVSNRPGVNFTGPNTICVGLTTTVSPITGGTWSSSNPGVASITNGGLVTGLSAGTTQLTFTETTTGCVSLPLTATISPRPISTLRGEPTICISDTTSLLPNTGGTWISNNNSVATITNDGIVTGVSQGTAIFTFTSTAGCASDPITSIAIMPNPTVSVSGPDNICINTTTQLLPVSGGTWASSDGAVATVSSGGLVTGVAEGIATFVFTSDAGCASGNTDVISVNPKPIVVVNGPSSICVGANTTLTPSVGGTWSSTNTAVATIVNNGTVTGVSPGTVRFIFTNTSTGCISDTSGVVTVTPGPDATLGPLNTLCIGQTTTLNPTSGGTWTSSHPSIASINNDGLVTAVSQGQATFRFRLTSTGCLSAPTDPITVNSSPPVSVTGPTQICIGNTTTLSPNTGGSWTSSMPSVATVTNGGVVTGVTPGTATFTFTPDVGCPSVATEPILVTPAPTATITGATLLCVGGTTTLSPSSGGTWSSSNNNIATVTNTGVVTGHATGKVTFMYVETASGCAASAPTDTLTIQQCFNPDFNATFVNILVPGNVSTNDNVSEGTVYGSAPVLRSNPTGSIQTLTMNPNGEGGYTFTANLPGVYVYNVQVCVPPLTSGCPTSELTITVANHLLPTPRPFAHVDFATTPMDTEVTLKTLANDGCAMVTGCDLDEESVTIQVNPIYGVATVNGANGDITYEPNPGFVGIDTLTYRVCVEPGNCATAKQVITVNSPTSLNNTVAADDFAVTAEFTPVSGNVKTNDSDAQGDAQAITPISTSVPAGSLELLADGSFTFTPADNFTGPVEFIYQTIDVNMTPDTAYATLHILVVPDLRIRVRVYLEGALMNNANQTADGRPLMRDNLRVSPFNSQNYIPTADPYRQATPFINFTNKFTKVAPGNRTEFLEIADPTAVFGVSGQNAIVDWVFIELRSKTSPTTVLATRSGLLQRDGDVVDIDGINGLRFPGIVMDDYHVVVRHIRHLGVMTLNPQTPQQLTTLVNFTTAALPVYDKGTVAGRNYTGLAMNSGVRVGYRAMWGGDFDASGKIKYDNPNDDLNVLYFNVFTYPTNPTGNVNFDFAYGYLPGDFDMNSKAKFDNPNDDKNMLFLQVLFYVLNTSLLSNYDFFIEQLP